MPRRRLRRQQRDEGVLAAHGRRRLRAARLSAPAAQGSGNGERVGRQPQGAAAATRTSAIAIAARGEPWLQRARQLGGHQHLPQIVTTLAPNYFSSSGAMSFGRMSGILGQMMIAASMRSIGTSMISVSLSANLSGTLATAQEIIRHRP